jgi:cyanophycin synthetase
MTLHIGRAAHTPSSTENVFPDAFRPWRAQLTRDGVRPVIAIAGSRGKSTVGNLLAAMFEQAGIVHARRAHDSVFIRGARQPDRDAWGRVLKGLDAGVFDIAIHELEWSDVAAIPFGTIDCALAAVTNVCANRDECLIQDESRLAVAALPKLVDATSPNGLLVMNCEDIDVIGPALNHERSLLFVGQNFENPALQFHLESGGIGAWRHESIDGASLRSGMLGSAADFGDPSDYRYLLWGAAGFQVTNALTAIALAASCGIAPATIRKALIDYQPPLAHDSIGVFRAAEIDRIKIVVDRPNPSWHLRQVVRAIRDAKAPRVITLVGKLESAPTGDLAEVGRLLGRLSNVLVVHSAAADDERTNQLRHGLAQNSTTPVVVHTQTERRALELAIDRARPDDLIFVLADNPEMVWRQIERPHHPSHVRSSLHSATEYV